MGRREEAYAAPLEALSAGAMMSGARQTEGADALLTLLERARPA